MIYRLPLEMDKSSPADYSAPLMRFHFPTAQAIQVHLPRVYLTRYVPFPGFLNLLVVYSSNCGVVLSRTTCTHGIRSTEFSPRTLCPTLVEYDNLP
jgi:hypothetical protein